MYKIIREMSYGSTKEITVYKYNINHDETIRYIRFIQSDGLPYLKIITSYFSDLTNNVGKFYDLRNGNKKWYKYKPIIFRG